MQGGFHFYHVQKRYIYIRKNGRSARSARASARCVHHMLVPCMSLMHGGTQHMSLSAANVQTSCSSTHVVHSSIVLIMEYAPMHHRRTVEVDCM